jgi:hypothetical protein
MVDIKDKKEQKNDLDKIRIRVLQTAEDYLYHNKTPKYPTFFSKWATRTVEGDYLKDLTEAEVSAVAQKMLLDKMVQANPGFIWYWQGYAAGILRFSEAIRSKAQKKIIGETLDGETDERDVINN